MGCSKGHYLDCVEIMERNSRHCDYIKNQAAELRQLIEDHYDLLEKHDALERAYFGQQTTIRNLQDNLHRKQNYIDRKKR